MAPGIITLTTDFGVTDHYVGVMKGVIHRIHPTATIVDITHQVRSYSALHGAFFIAQAYRWFPAGTVHAVVVDPGVGTKRRAIVADAAGQLFVAPDNGVLSHVFEREDYAVRAIDIDRFGLQPVSQTFHGRDVFAPAAAKLAAGEPFEQIGPEVSDPVTLPRSTPAQTQPGRWLGRVLNVDRFGNLVTSFEPAHLPSSGFEVEAGGLKVDKLSSAYGEAKHPDAAFAIVGSSGYVEVSVNQASAAEKAGVDIGDEVWLTTK